MTTLAEAFQELQALLDRYEIRYLIGGSVASGSHGMARQTQDIDFVADFTGVDIEAFCKELSATFYVDTDAVREAVLTCRSFNAIHSKGIYKFDLFPAGANEFALSELARRQYIVSQTPWLKDVEFPVASPEDTILSKLVWFRKGGEVSEQQWKDVLNVLRVQKARLETDYMDEWGRKLGVSDLLERARIEAGDSVAHDAAQARENLP